MKRLTSTLKMFKKKKLKARKTKKSFFIGLIGFMSILAVFFLAISVISHVNIGDFNVYKTISSPGVSSFLLSPEEKEKQKILRKQQEELEEKRKEDENKTNILILGRGGYRNDAPELTDSIILASINKENNYISLLSIPRDLYVNYGDTSKYGGEIAGKINGLYVHYLAKFQDEEKAVAKLQEKITQITNEKIDHYVNIDFNGFIKLVDSLGGIPIVVPKTLIDNQYPNETHGYQSFILRKGTWLLDGEVALKYVRSRKNTGGDFGRSQRQQQVIESLKSKILSGGYLTSPSKIKKLYNIFNQYLSTDIDIISAVKLFTEIKLQDDTKVYSSGLNASCIKSDECDKGGYMYYPQRVFFGGQSVLLGESADQNNLDTFSKIQAYSKIIFNSPELFEEKHKISIFTTQEDTDDAEEVREELKKIGLEINILERIGNIPESQDTLSNINATEKKKMTLAEYNATKNTSGFQSNIEKGSSENISQEYNNSQTKIIINGVDKKSATLNYLKQYFEITDTEIEESTLGPKYARDKNTKIEILYKK